MLLIIFSVSLWFLLTYFSSTENVISAIQGPEQNISLFVKCFKLQTITSTHLPLTVRRTYTQENKSICDQIHKVT